MTAGIYIDEDSMDRSLGATGEGLRSPVLFRAVELVVRPAGRSFSIQNQNSFGHKLGAKADSRKIVDVQHTDGHAANGCLANQKGSVPTKMPCPRMTPRMKQFR